jgi:hypothetical protein
MPSRTWSLVELQVPQTSVDVNAELNAVAITSHWLAINFNRREVWGNTPSTIQLSPGEHTVRVEASGHKAWSRTLTVTAGSKSTVQAVLMPLA